MTTYQPSDVLVETLVQVRDMLLQPGVPAPRSLSTTFVLLDFAVDDAALRPDHHECLDALTLYLSEHPDARVSQVVGRASQTGPDARNDSLSFDRAETVRAYLLAAALPSSQLGPAVAGGSREPIVHAPDREAALNRSVEVHTQWFHVAEPAPPTPPPGTGSTQWQLTLTVTFAIARGFGGQAQIGRLTNLATGESRGVTALFLGIDAGKSLFLTAAAGVGVPSTGDGIIRFRTPVDWDWFTGQLIVLGSVGVGAAVAGFSGTVVMFVDPTQDLPTWSSVDYTVGFTIGAGGQGMLGTLLVPT